MPSLSTTGFRKYSLTKKIKLSKIHKVLLYILLNKRMNLLEFIKATWAVVGVLGIFYCNWVNFKSTDWNFSTRLYVSRVLTYVSRCVQKFMSIGSKLTELQRKIPQNGSPAEMFPLRRDPYIDFDCVKRLGCVLLVYTLDDVNTCNTASDSQLDATHCNNQSALLCERL